MSRVVISAICFFVLILCFQNCGESFDLKDGLEFKSVAPPPRMNPTPVLKSPTTVINMGVNLPFRSTLLASDDNSEQDLIQYEIVDSPVNGQLVLEPRAAGDLQNYSYTPGENFLGMDSFSFKAVDETGRESEVATIVVNVVVKGIGKLIGNWQHPTCVPNTAPVTTSLQVTKEGYTETGMIFSDDCQTQLLALTASGNHTIGKEQQDITGGVKATEYNITSSVRRLRPVSEEAATALNNANYCGYADWVNNVEKDISTTGCNGLWAATNLFMYIRVDFSNVSEIKMWRADINSGNTGAAITSRTQGLLGYFLTKQ